MRSYELIKLLKTLNYTFVKQYPRYEVWEKEGSYFSFPNQELISNIYVKPLLKEIHERN